MFLFLDIFVFLGRSKFSKEIFKDVRSFDKDVISIISQEFVNKYFMNIFLNLFNKGSFCGLSKIYT